MRRIASRVAESMGATASVDFRVNFAPTVNNADEAGFAASVCAEHQAIPLGSALFRGRSSASWHWREPVSSRNVMPSSGRLRHRWHHSRLPPYPDKETPHD
jgi:metal-dependent amidase/aminoacylase/carboxypeptidase family protein